MSREVAVIGAGVIGLTSAIELLRAGHRVTIFTRERPAHTTSAVPAAIWFPYYAQPEADVTRWALATRERLRAFVGEPRAGVRWVDFSRVWKDSPPPVEKWMAADELTWLAADELPPGFRYGYRIAVPLMENPAYLTYLEGLFHESGGRLVTTDLQSLVEVPPSHELIVNCTGYGARALCDDRELHAGRGAVVLVDRIAAERHVVHDERADTLTYVVSRSGDCVLGGCDETSDLLATSLGEAEAILKRCAVVGDCADVRLRSVEVGIRPVRDAGVRLEAAQLEDGRTVIHNYGHGGAGFTLSWGCAEDVAVAVLGNVGISP
ncbi:MAG TPA: FAD-dependent oxidoreductase [Thermoanaerobaculia bacterium]